MVYNTVIQCLVVDDEPPVREVIKRYIEAVPTLHLAGECANAIEAMTFLQQKKADIIFLDIRMPQLNGTDFIKTLKMVPRVIFTTAHAEYALEGYELDVADYLLKPIQFDRFLKAVNKAFHLQAPVVNEPVIVQPSTQEPFVYFRADRKMVKVLLQDILYVESMKDYVKVVTTNNTIITKQAISSVEAMLPQTRFIRTHRSFIVALDKIRSFTPEIIGINNTEIPIGKLYRQGVMKMLTEKN